MSRWWSYKFSRELILLVKNAHSKYVADVEMQKEIQSKEKLEQEMKKKEQDVLQTQKQKIDKLELELSSQKSSLKVAGESIKEGNIKLQNALLEKALSREKIQEALAMTDTGLDRKRCIEKNIGEISQKKIKLSKI